MSQPGGTASGLTNLGFLTVLQEAGGYLGGYLVTNIWGRPLEFRLSSAVQQILYGPTLQPYLCADLIGKTLVDKAGVPVQLVVTDREVVLELRLKLDVPVVWLVPTDDPRPVEGEAVVRPAANGQGAVVCHARHAASDVPVVRELLARLEGLVDLAEPFGRIREAIGEARKLGVTARAA